MQSKSQNEIGRPDHFADIDRQLFERLYYGSLEPLIVTLNDGQKLVGETKGIIRGIQADASELPEARGTILLLTARGEVEIDYTNIATIT